MSILEERIMPFLEEQGVEVIGAFRAGLGGASNQFVIWAAYRDMAHLQSVVENSTLTEIQEQTFEAMWVLEAATLTPVSFSPMR